jgi:hypothetical protein
MEVTGSLKLLCWAFSLTLALAILAWMLAPIFRRRLVLDRARKRLPLGLPERKKLTARRPNKSTPFHCKISNLNKHQHNVVAAELPP